MAQFMFARFNTFCTTSLSSVGGTLYHLFQVCTWPGGHC